MTTRDILLVICLIVDTIVVGCVIITDMKKPGAVARAGFCLEISRCG